MMTLVERHTDIDENTVEWMHPMVLAAKANAEDNPTWDQAMNGPDHEGYLEACRKELKTLSEDKDAWDVVDRADWMNVLPPGHPHDDRKPPTMAYIKARPPTETILTKNQSGNESHHDRQTLRPGNLRNDDDMLDSLPHSRQNRRAKHTRVRRTEQYW
jgi:hypothetical protein